MEPLHSLLHRQLVKRYGSAEQAPPEVRPLIAMVDDAYRQADIDRAMLERSLELSSQELRQANEDLWRVFRLLPDRFFRVDRRGVILDGGDDGAPSGRVFAGKHIGEALGARAGKALQQAIDQTAATGKRATVELAGEGNDEGRFFEGILLPLTENQIVIFIRDKTRELRLQEQLRQSQKMEAVGQLAGGIAHDFNNLLTVILGNVELESGRRSKNDMVALDGIRAAAERAAALTGQLLAFGRKQVLHPRSVNLNDTVAQMVELLRRLIGENIRIEADLSADAGPVLVDPMQLEQVIMNLALNARDAMPEGGTLTFHTANFTVEAPPDTLAVQEIPPGSYVAFAVHDTGVGITPEVRTHLFEPFFTTKPVGKGSGLGLATVYGIVKQSGGHISVDSAPGHGATFRLLLPRGDLADTLHDFRHGPQGETVLPGRETILVVEDEESIRKLTTTFLQRQGYQVLTAGSGEEALGLLARKATPIQMLLTDVMMQGLGGVELSRRIRKQYPAVRVLYMSGYPDSTVAELGIDALSRNYIKKPFRGSDLVEKVRRLLDHP